MDFDFGDMNTNEETTTKKDVTSNDDKGINEFVKNLITAEDFKIETNEKLLNKFEQFIENDFFEIVMNDEIFDEKQQVKLVREIDYYKWAFLELINKPYLNNKLIIAVAGNFSAGKSSLLNALLDTNLPVDVEATTAIPTYITFFSNLHKGFLKKFKRDGNYMIVSSAFGIKIMETDFLKYIIKESIKDFPLPLNRFLDYFVLSVKKDILKDKVIIDTPGINPSDKKGLDFDEVITKNAISLANVVLWVMDVDNGDLTNDSIRFLKENISENQDLVVIVNKVDKKPPKEVEKVLNQVKKTLGKYIKAKTLGVIPFSKKDKKTKKDLNFYIKTLKVKNTVPEIIESIDIYLEFARETVVDKILKEKDVLKMNQNFFKDKDLKRIFTDEQIYHNLLKKYENNEEFINIIKEVKNLFEKGDKLAGERMKELIDFLNYEYKIFGNNYYYFYENQQDEFANKIENIVMAYKNSFIDMGFLIGIKTIELIEEKYKKIEKLEALETKINNAINKFEDLKDKLKKLV